MSDLIYKELSYKLTGFVFDIDNKIGYGHNEKVYADCFEKLLIKNNLSYAREVYYPVVFEGNVIKKYYLDFLVEDKIVVELKVNDVNYKQVCFQVSGYLKSSNKNLGLVFRFTKSGVRQKRIVNIN